MFDSITIYIGNSQGFGNQANTLTLLKRLIVDYRFQGSVRVIYNEHVRIKLREMFDHEFPPYPIGLDLSDPCLFFLTRLKEITFIPMEYFSRHMENFPWTDLGLLCSPMSGASALSYKLLSLKAKHVLRLHPPGWALESGFNYFRADRWGEERLAISSDATLKIPVPDTAAIDTCLSSTSLPQLQTIHSMVRGNLTWQLIYGMDLKTLQATNFPVEYLLLNLVTAACAQFPALHRPLVLFVGYTLTDKQLQNLREVFAGRCPKEMDGELITAIQKRLVQCQQENNVTLTAFSATAADAPTLVRSLPMYSVSVISGGNLPQDIFHYLAEHATMATAEGANLLNFLQIKAKFFIPTKYGITPTLSPCLEARDKVICEAKRALSLGINQQRILWLSGNFTSPDQSLAEFMRQSFDPSPEWQNHFRFVPQQDILDEALHQVSFDNFSSLPDLAKIRTMCDAVRSGTSLPALPTNNPYEQHCESSSSLLGLAIINRRDDVVAALEALRIPLFHRLAVRDAPARWKFLFALEEPSNANHFNQMTQTTELLLNLQRQLVNHRAQDFSIAEQRLIFNSAIAWGREDWVSELCIQFPQILQTAILTDHSNRIVFTTPLSIAIAGRYWNLMEYLLSQGAALNELEQRYLARFGTPELLRHYNVSLPTQILLEESIHGRNLPLLNTLMPKMSECHIVAETLWQPQYFTPEDPQYFTPEDFKFVTQLFPHLAPREQQNFIHRSVELDCETTAPPNSAQLTFILSQTQNQPLTSQFGSNICAPKSRTNICAPSLRAALLYGQNATTTESALLQYGLHCSWQNEREARSFLSCYQNGLGHDVTTEQVVTNCLQKVVHEESPPSLDLSQTETTLQATSETAAASFFHEGVQATKNGFIYGFIDECIEHCGKSMHVSEAMRHWLRRTGKFLIAAIINESWASGTINCVVDLLLASGKCSPEVANYLGTAISIALTSYLYFQTGPLRAVAGFVGGLTGSWLGAKVFWGVKTGIAFFRATAKDTLSIYCSDIASQHTKTV